MDVKNFVEACDPQDVQSALIQILSRYTQPAFGALPKREADILIFEVMRSLNLLPEDASVYDLMTDLRITRSKATQLLFDTAIRKFDENPALLDAKVLDVLCSARFHKDADQFFLLEVEDPMLNANLKEKVRKAGHISDSSFNTALIRLPLDAITDLAASLLPPELQFEVKNALVAAGAPEETTFKNVVTASLKALGAKVMGSAADGVIDEAGAFLAPILRNTGEIVEKWMPIFATDEG